MFLDRLASAVAPPGAHLLDHTWSRVFTNAELNVREAVMTLLHGAEDDGVRDSLRREVGDALRRFGGAPHE